MPSSLVQRIRIRFGAFFDRFQDAPCAVLSVYRYLGKPDREGPNACGAHTATVECEYAIAVRILRARVQFAYEIFVRPVSAAQRRFPSGAEHSPWAERPAARQAAPLFGAAPGNICGRRQSLCRNPRY